VSRDHRNKMKKNQSNSKANVEFLENDGIKSPGSLSIAKEEKRDENKTGILYSSRSAGEGFEIRMSSLRAIKEGEELCFDYGHLYSPADGWAV
jgi:SET domain-containing protein